MKAMLPLSAAGAATAFALLLGLTVGITLPSSEPVAVASVTKDIENTVFVLDTKCEYVITPMCSDAVDDFGDDFRLTPEGQAMYDSAGEFKEVQ